MSHAKRSASNPKRRAIPILALISAITIIVAYLIFSIEVKYVAPFVSELVESGKSLFIPDLPTFNVLWFLPHEIPIRFSSGQVVDIAIIWFMVSSVFYFGYPYYKALKSRNDFDYLYLDKAGRLKKGSMEAPLSKSFMVGNNQMVLVDFKIRLDRGQARETQVKHVVERLLDNEERKSAKGTASGSMQGDRALSDHGHFLKNSKFSRLSRVLGSSLHETLLQRFSFLKLHSNHELTSRNFSTLSFFHQKLNERGK
jgi:hypothetical protein